jgi:hypothetical protein
MSTETSSSSVPAQERHSSPREISALFDWFVGGVLLVVGMALTLGGWALLLVNDREFVENMVAEGELQSGSLTPEELVEFALPFFEWLAIGLLVFGVVVAVAGIAFVVSRRRTRKAAAAEGRSAGTFGANATYGAVVTLVLSGIPGSAALGGAVSAYLQGAGNRSGAKVGAVSGLIAALPVVVLVAFVFVGLVDGLAAVGESALQLLIGGVGLFALAVVLLFSAGLGGVGGVVGERFADRD